MLTVEAIQSALTQWIDPDTQKDYITSRSVRNLKVEAGQVFLDIELGYPAKSQLEGIRQQLEDLLRTLP